MSDPIVVNPKAVPTPANRWHGPASAIPTGATDLNRRQEKTVSLRPVLNFGLS